MSRHDAGENIVGRSFTRYVIADKGYDSDPLRDQIRRRGAKPVIPSRQGTRRR
jgi:transposase